MDAYLFLNIQLDFIHVVEVTDCGSVLKLISISTCSLMVRLEMHRSVINICVGLDIENISSLGNSNNVPNP